MLDESSSKGKGEMTGVIVCVAVGRLRAGPARARSVPEYDWKEKEQDEIRDHLASMSRRETDEDWRANPKPRDISDTLRLPLRK